MPPLDPSIILQARPQQFQQQDPLDNYAKIMAIQSGMGQQDLQNVQLQQAREGLDSNQRLRALFSSNPKATADDVMGIDPKTGMAMRKQEVDNRKTLAETEHQSASAREADYKVQLGKLQHGAALLNEAKDPQSFNAVLRVGLMTKTFDPEFVQKMQEQGYSPQLVEQLKAAGLTHEEQLQEKNRTATLAETNRHNVTGEVETGRHNTAQETTARGQLGVSQGNLSVARDRLAFDKAQPKGQYDADRGVLVDPRTGVAKPVVDAAGAPIAPKDKPLTESQGKATGMALRAQRANDILNTLEDAGETNRGIIKQAAGHVPLIGGGLEMGVNMLPHLGGLGAGPSENQQKVEQARRDFINAALRVESGASISPSEFQNAERQYFPMPGDTAEVIKQKRQARQNEIDGLKLQSGPGEKKVTSLKGVDPAKLSDAELKRELGI